MENKMESHISKKLVLGIETSCDETSAAIVRSDGTILSNLVLSQLSEHEAFGGVVPEIAARAHLDHLDRLIRGALEGAEVDFHDLSAVAATCGPGLIGGVMVGMMAGKAIASAHKLPFIAVNHLEGHVLTPRLTDKIEFPYLVLLVSGGHTQILVADGVGQYRRLGTTLDDALGECFDKSAKLMGLGYPGGPNLEKMADQCADGQAAIRRFPLPRPMLGREECDFSFSGLKTAVRNHVEKLPSGDLSPQDIADLAYAFQMTVGEILKDRCARSIEEFFRIYPQSSHFAAKPAKLVVCGGVAANKHIRDVLQGLTKTAKMDFIAPPLELCSDNGAMIAWVGVEKLALGELDGLDVAARPRWPLDPNAEKKIGAGVKA
ncbi:MAG: tRNA (adenosine(37)-N6)-threonylcarbamoyltransferase complex transferase subunit TsaD [Alphaproteobacteria bacterium]|nr:tRNA (adenosine(37)-N6)-threonylcarbamoyltransferase complex transferase subunit TsaD [Alphaproteobacteria bacterium]